MKRHISLVAALLISAIGCSANAADDFVFRSGTTGLIVKSTSVGGTPTTPGPTTPTTPDPGPTTPQQPDYVSVPEIADQARTVLGKGGQAITTWSPVVVDAETKGLIKGAITFTASHDLAAFGLALNPLTGAITGTPKPSGFIIPNFRITATTSAGSDSTPEFWLGVEPAGELELSTSQPAEYFFVSGEDMVTSPIIVYNAVGDIKYSLPENIVEASRWNSSTGVARLGTVGAVSSTTTTNYITIASDEFGRTLSIPFAVTKYNFRLSTPTGTTDIFVRSSATRNWKSVTASGNIGSTSFEAWNLPPGLSLQAVGSGWQIRGVYQGTYADLGREYSFNIRATDSATSSSVVGQYKFRVVSPLTISIWNNGNFYTPETLRRTNTSRATADVYDAGSFGLRPGTGPLTVTVASGAMPAGMSFAYDGNGSISFPGAITAKNGIYKWTMKVVDSAGYQVTSSEFQVTVTN